MKHNSTLLVSLILAISIFAYWLQTYFFLESDVIYLLHAAEKLLQGGTYSQNFFETNPPMILYLYFPVLFLKIFLKLNLITALRIYIIGLSCLSLSVANYYLNNIILKTKERSILLAGIAFILLCLPFCEFGQKDHLMLILTMPYWCLTAVRAKKENIPALAAILTGLAAGFGFSLKPFFLMPLVLVECYLIFIFRQILTIFRAEMLAVGLIMISYFFSIIIFQPDYLQIIWPLVSRYYFSGVAEPWSIMLERTPPIFCFAIVFLSPYFCKLSRFKCLAIIFSLVLTGLIAAFLIPQTSWYCHALPAFGIACLLGFLLCLEVTDIIIRIIFLITFLSVAGYFGYTLLCSEFAIRYNQAMNELIKIVDQRPAVKIYCMPTHHVCSLLSEYSNAHSVSKFPSLWALRGLIKPPSSHYQHIIQDREFFLEQLAQDINKTKPDFLIFDTQWKIGSMQSGSDYTAYFSKNLTYKENWAHYRFFRAVGAYVIYSRYDKHT